MRIRHATPEDFADLMHVYRDAVRTIGPQHYSDAQVESWASFGVDAEAFREKILGTTCLLLEAGSTIAGFATLEPNGMIGLVYVRGDRAREGIATTLLEALLARARQQGLTRLRTVASEFSRGLFEHFGFRLRETERAERAGVGFTRYVMERNG